MKEDEGRSVRRGQTKESLRRSSLRESDVAVSCLRQQGTHNIQIVQGIPKATTTTRSRMAQRREAKGVVKD